jgi:DNA primase large subunit
MTNDKRDGAMMKTAKKKKTVTAKRKVFLEAVKILEEHFDSQGIVKTSSFAISEALIELRDRSPKNRGVPQSFWDIAASALYLLQMRDEFRTVRNTNETCKGGMAFHAMYDAGFDDGWNAGMKAGKEMREAQS